MVFLDDDCDTVRKDLFFIGQERRGVSLTYPMIPGCVY